MCADCDTNPGAATCLNCCDTVTVASTTASNAWLVGDYTYSSSDSLVNDRKVYKKDTTCLYYNSNNQRWFFVACDSITGNSA